MYLCLSETQIVVVVNLEVRDYLRPAAVHSGPGGIVGRLRARGVDLHGEPLVVPYSGAFEQRIRDIADGELELLS